MIKEWSKLGWIACFAVCFSSCNDEQEEARLKAAAERQRLELKRLAEEELLREEAARVQKESEEMRQRAREAAVGTKMEVLQALNGKIYNHVEILEVSAVGISLKHESGLARVPFENLPKVMREQFYFDPEEKEEVLLRQRKQQNIEAMRAASLEQTNLDKTNQTERAASLEKRKKLQTELAMVSLRVNQLKNEISGLEDNLSDDLSEAMRHRYDGKSGGVSRAPIIRQSIEAKRNQLDSALRREAAIQSELRN